MPLCDIRLLRAQDRVATPWKNGGGTTSEVAAFPPGSGLENFGWRVSIADVRQGGPFSLFAGIDRQLALLDGQLSLSIAGRPDIELTPDAMPVAFAGDTATHASLVRGPAADLNVMTRRNLFTSRMERRAGPQKIALNREAAATFIVALEPATLHHGDKEIVMEARDALLAEGQSSGVLRVSSDSNFYFIEIFAKR